MITPDTSQNKKNVEKGLKATNGEATTPSVSETIENMSVEEIQEVAEQGKQVPINSQEVNKALEQLDEKTFTKVALSIADKMQKDNPVTLNATPQVSQPNTFKVTDNNSQPKVGLNSAVVPQINVQPKTQAQTTTSPASPQKTYTSQGTSSSSSTSEQKTLFLPEYENSKEKSDKEKALERYYQSLEQDRDVPFYERLVSSMYDPEKEKQKRDNYQRRRENYQGVLALGEALFNAINSGSKNAYVRPRNIDKSFEQQTQRELAKLDREYQIARERLLNAKSQDKQRKDQIEQTLYNIRDREDQKKWNREFQTNQFIETKIANAKRNALGLMNYELKERKFEETKSKNAHAIKKDYVPFEFEDAKKRHFSVKLLPKQFKGFVTRMIDIGLKDEATRIELANALKLLQPYNNQAQETADMILNGKSSTAIASSLPTNIASQMATIVASNFPERVGACLYGIDKEAFDKYAISVKANFDLSYKDKDTASNQNDVDEYKKLVKDMDSSIRSGKVFKDKEDKDSLIQYIDSL